MKEREKKCRRRGYREKRINTTRCLVSRRRRSPKVLLFDSLGVRHRYKDPELVFKSREFLNYDGEIDFSRIYEMMVERAAEHRSISPPPPSPVDDDQDQDDQDPDQDQDQDHDPEDPEDPEGDDNATDDDHEDLEADDDDDSPPPLEDNEDDEDDGPVLKPRPPTPPRVNDDDDEEGDDEDSDSFSENSDTPSAPSYKDFDGKIGLKSNPFEEYLKMHMNILQLEPSLSRTADIIKQSLMWKKCYEIYENYKKEVSIPTKRPSKFDVGYSFPDDHLDNPNCACKLCFTNWMTVDIMLRKVIHWGFFIDGAIDCFKNRFSKFMMIQIKMISQNNYDVVDFLDELICRGFRAVDPPFTILYLEKYFKAIYSTFGLIAGEILTKMSSFAKQNMTYEDAANFMKYYIEIGERVYMLAEKMSDYLSCLNWKLKAYGLTVRVFILQIYCKLVYELPDVKQMVDRSLKILKLTKNFDSSCLDATKVHIQTLEDLAELLKEVLDAKQAWETKSLPFPFEDSENLGVHALKLAALRNPFEETTPNQVESYEILFDKGKGKFELKEANKEELFSSPFLWLPILDASFTNQRDERYSVRVIRSLDYFSFDDDSDDEGEESLNPPQPVDNRNRELSKKEFDEKARHLQAYLGFRATPSIQSVEGRIDESFDDFKYFFKTPDSPANVNSNVIQYKLDLDTKASNSARLKKGAKKAKKISLPLYSRKYDHGSMMGYINGSLNKLRKRLNRTRGPLEEFLQFNPFLETLKDKNFIVELLLQVLKLGIRAIKYNTCKVSCAYYLELKLESDEDEQVVARPVALKNAMCLQYDILRAFDLLNDHERNNLIYKYYETDKNAKRINISTYIDSYLGNNFAKLKLHPPYVHKKTVAQFVGKKFLEDKDKGAGGGGGGAGKDLVISSTNAASNNNNSSQVILDETEHHPGPPHNSKKCENGHDNDCRTGEASGPGTDCLSKYHMVDSLISRIILKPGSRNQIDNIYGVQTRYDELSEKEKVVIKKVLMRELKKIPENQFGDDELDQISSDEIVFFICKMSGCKIPHVYQKKLNKSLRQEHNSNKPKSLIYKYMTMSLTYQSPDENDDSEPKECPKSSNVQHLCTEHEHHHHSSAPNSQSSRDEEPDRVPSVHASMFNNTSERTIFAGPKHVHRDYMIRKERMLKKLLESKATAGANKDSSNIKEQKNQPPPSNQTNNNPATAAQKPTKEKAFEDIDALVDQIEGNKPSNHNSTVNNNDDEKAARKREKKALKKERREAKKLEEEQEARRLEEQRLMKEREEAERLRQEQIEKDKLEMQMSKKLKKQNKKQRQKEREKAEQLARENPGQGTPLEPVFDLDDELELSKKQKKALKKSNNKSAAAAAASSSLNQPEPEKIMRLTPRGFHEVVTPPPSSKQQQQHQQQQHESKMTGGCSVQNFIMNPESLGRGKKTDMVTIRRHPESDSKVTISSKNDQGEEGLLFTLINGQVYQNENDNNTDDDGKKKSKKKNKKVKKQQQQQQQNTSQSSEQYLQQQQQQTQQPVVSIHPISNQVNLAETASYTDYTSLHNNGYMSGISQQPQSSKSFALLSQLDDDNDDSDDEEIDISRLKLPPGITITKLNHSTDDQRKFDQNSALQHQPEITCTPSHSGGGNNNKQFMSNKVQQQQHKKKLQQNVQYSDDVPGGGGRFDASMLTEDDIFGLSRDNKGEFETVISRSKRNKAKVKDVGSSIVPPPGVTTAGSAAQTPFHIQEILGLKSATTATAAAAGAKLKLKKHPTQTDPNVKVNKYDYSNAKTQSYLKQKPPSSVNQPGSVSGIKYRTTVYRNSNYHQQQQQQQDFSNVKGYKSNTGGVPRFNNSTTSSYGGLSKSSSLSGGGPSNDFIGTMGYFDVNSLNGSGQQQKQKQQQQTNNNPNAWNPASANYNDFQLQRLENLSLEEQPSSSFQKSSSADPSENLREDAFSTMNEPVHWSEPRLLGPFGSDYVKRDKSATNSPAGSNERTPRAATTGPPSTTSKPQVSSQHGASRNISFDKAPSHPSRSSSAKIFSSNNSNTTYNPIVAAVAGQQNQNQNQQRNSAGAVGTSSTSSNTSKLFENPNIDTINTLSKIDEMMVKMVAEYPEFSNFKLRGPSSSSNQDDVSSITSTTMPESVSQIMRKQQHSAPPPPMNDNNNSMLQQKSKHQQHQQQQQQQGNFSPGAPILKPVLQQVQPSLSIPQQIHKSPGAIGSDRPSGQRVQQHQQNIFGSIGSGSSSSGGGAKRMIPDQYGTWSNGLESKYGPSSGSGSGPTSNSTSSTTSSTNPQNGGASGPLSAGFASFLEKFAGNNDENHRNDEMERINRYTDPEMGTGSSIPMTRHHPGAIGQGHHRPNVNKINNFGGSSGSGVGGSSIPYNSSLPSPSIESPIDTCTSYSPFYTPNFNSNAVGLGRNVVQRPSSTYSPHQMHSSTPTPPPGTALFTDYPPHPPRPQSGSDIGNNLTNSPSRLQGNLYYPRPNSQQQQQHQQTPFNPYQQQQQQMLHEQQQHFEQIRRNSEGVQGQPNEMNHFWPK